MLKLVKFLISITAIGVLVGCTPSDEEIIEAAEEVANEELEQDFSYITFDSATVFTREESLESGFDISENVEYTVFGLINLDGYTTYYIVDFDKDMDVVETVIQ